MIKLVAGRRSPRLPADALEVAADIVEGDQVDLAVVAGDVKIHESMSVVGNVAVNGVTEIKIVTTRIATTKIAIVNVISTEAAIGIVQKNDTAIAVAAIAENIGAGIAVIAVSVGTVIAMWIVTVNVTAAVNAVIKRELGLVQRDNWRKKIERKRKKEDEEKTRRKTS